MSKKAKAAPSSAATDAPTTPKRGSSATPTGDSKKQRPGSQIDHLIATIYFLDWSKNILELFTKLVNRHHVAPLTEHCVRKRVTNATISEHSEQSTHVLETGRKLEEGVKVDDTYDELKQLQRRLLKAKNETEADAYYAPVRREKWISLTETSAMYRLRTLVQMSGSLLIFMERIRAWVEAHRHVLASYRRLCSEVLESAVLIFEAICAQADVFGLEPVDRRQVRADCAKFIDVADTYAGARDRSRNKTLVLGDKVDAEVKRLEGVINAYRASVFLIGNSLTDITQHIMKTVPRNQLEVTTKEVRSIMERLPPAYVFAGSVDLAAATKRLLSVQPPNRRHIDVSERKKLKMSGVSTRTASNIDVSTIVPRTSRTDDTNGKPSGATSAADSGKQRASVATDRTQSAVASKNTSR